MLNMKAVKSGAFTDYITTSDVLLDRGSLTDYQGEELEYLSLPELGIDAKSLTFWHGGLARALGLEDLPVEKAHSDALDAGRHPFTGAKLLQNAGRTSPDALGRTASGGVSFVFAGPKVDDVLFLAFPEHRLRIVRDTIDAAKSAIDYLEDRAVLSRTGKAGRETVHATGAWACAVHFFSRNGQIFIHVHAHLKQAVLCEDSVTRSLHNVALFEHQRAAGDLFDSIRARQLQALGFDIRPAERAYRCEGVPDVVIDLLSRRRAEIVAKLDEWGTRSAHAAEIAAYQGRGDKTERTLSETLKQHEAETRAIGWPVERIREAVLSHRLEQKQEPTHDRAAELSESVHRAAQKPPDETHDFSAYPDAPRALPLRAVEELTFQKALDFLAVPFSALAEIAARVFDRIKTEYQLDLDPYELRGAKLESIRPYIERDTARLLEYEAPRTFARSDRLGAAPAAPSDELRGMGLLRTLDERDPARRHELIEGIARELKADGFRCIAITQKTADKELLASVTEGLFPVFTAAKAATEWDNARWRLGKSPDQGKFEAPRTDPIQDLLAQHIAGTMSRDHVKYNAWQRERAPLNLGDGHKHAIFLEGADALDARRLYGILFEARRHRALVIACGDAAGRSDWFSALCERFAPTATERAQQNQLDELTRRRALEPVPTLALGR